MNTSKLSRITQLVSSVDTIVDHLFAEVADTKSRIDELTRLLLMKEHAAKRIVAEAEHNVLPLLRNGVSCYSVASILRSFEEALNVSLGQMELLAEHLSSITATPETRTAYLNNSCYLREDFDEISKDVYANKDIEAQSPEEIAFCEIIETSHYFITH